MFIINYFARIFEAPYISKMLVKLAELHTYVETSKALLSSIRKALALQSNASANKIIETIQAIS